jgi:quinol monooxygenase YgiN
MRSNVDTTKNTKRTQNGIWSFVNGVRKQVNATDWRRSWLKADQWRQEDAHDEHFNEKLIKRVSNID